MRHASTCPPRRAPRRGSVLRPRLLLLALALLAGPTLAQQISSHLIASGGGVSRSPGGCRVLEGSLGQPALGTSSGGAFTVRAGYWAGPGSQRRDRVFSAGFEGCN